MNDELNDKMDLLLPVLDKGRGRGKGFVYPTLSEETRPLYDASAMFPAAAQRVELLEKIKRSWPLIAGRVIAMHSRPYNLGVSELSVQVVHPQAKTQLIKMKGTIARNIAKRFGYDFGDNFVLTLTDTIPPPKQIARRPHKNIYAGIVVTDEEIAQCMSNAPDTLPEDINHAISSLQVFLEKIAAKESRK